LEKLSKVLKKVEAVVFDMDGVLSDTEPIYLNIEKKIISRYGKTLTDRLIEKIKGSSLVDAMGTIVRELDIKADPQKLALEEEREFRNYILDNPIPVVPCAKDLIEIVKNLGYRIALATSTAFDNAIVILSKTGFKDHFEVIITGDKVENTKPAPDIYLKCSQMLNIDPQFCLAIEDSLNGCKAAKNAGMLVIAVNVDNKAVMEFEKVANMVYNSNCELMEDFKKINRGAY